MAAETIVVDNIDATDVTYTEVVPVTPGTREFRDLTNGTAALPRRYVFSRISATDRSKGVDRVRVYVSRAITNSGSGKTNIGSVTLEIVIPLEGGDFTPTILGNMVSNLTDFLVGSSFANSTALVQGSVNTGDFSD